METTVAIVRTGVANTASIIACFARLGVEAAVCDDAVRIAQAPAVVLPGVGTFGAAMAAIKEAQLDQVLEERIIRGAPLMAICAGYQVLFESSEESPRCAGLGVFQGLVRRFPSGVRVPQFGWNRLTTGQTPGVLTGGYAYFANSYAVTGDAVPSARFGEVLRPESLQTATATHGVPFIGAISCGSFLGCQFHPELSGPWGQRLLSRWLSSAGCTAGESSTC